MKKETPPFDEWASDVREILLQECSGLKFLYRPRTSQLKKWYEQGYKAEYAAHLYIHTIDPILVKCLVVLAVLSIIGLLILSYCCGGIEYGLICVSGLLCGVAIRYYFLPDAENNS